VYQKNLEINPNPEIRDSAFGFKRRMSIIFGIQKSEISI